MKIKIVHIVPHYFPSIGGVEQVAKDLCEGLVKLGHDVTVLTNKRLQKAQKKEKLKTFEIINGVKVYRYFSLVSLGHMSFTPSAILNIISNNYDIIHMHSIRHPHTIYVPLIKIMKNYRIILQGHTHFSSTHLKTLLYNNFDKILFQTLYKSVDIFLHLNSDEKQKLMKLGVPEKKLALFYNPIKDSLFDKSDSDLFNKKYELENKKIILFLGQAHEGKRVDLIIKALPKILLNEKNTLLLIAGPDFGNYPKLKELASLLNVVNNVKFLGLLSEEEKEFALKRCDVLILPSEYEAFGVVLAEAMACGNPVIATKTPGPLELINHGKNGFLIDRNSVDQIADYTIKLFENENLRLSIGAYAKNYAKDNFSINSLVSILESVYSSCLRNN
jgi:glycosyltransferase involved in cell wall biosynthesis